MTNSRPENAKATQFRSGDEAVKNGKKGGKASGKSRNRKKLLREYFEILLEKKITDKNGVTMTGAEAMATKVFQLALKGDLKAFEIVRDTAGQKPIEKVVVSEVDNDVIDEVERMIKNDADTSG